MKPTRGLFPVLDHSHVLPVDENILLLVVRRVSQTLTGHCLVVVLFIPQRREGDKNVKNAAEKGAARHTVRNTRARQNINVNRGARGPLGLMKPSGEHYRAVVIVLSEKQGS